ncbi:MAG: DUF6141 family protein [bacterium]
MNDSPGFRETQRLRQAWIIGLTLLPAFLAWYVFIVQVVLGRPAGNNPAPDWGVWLILALVGIGLPALLFSARLDVAVEDSGVRIRYFPFLRRFIPWDAIRSAEACTYRPMAHFWGWGIRWSSHEGWAYTASGNHGVRLELADGRRLLLGSQRPGELAETIRARLACPGPSPR